jgi:hypothetical protein
MGAKGPGHKSPRARQARLINIQKARAARRRAPLPWRSGLESRVIEQLVWQWWQSPAPKWPAVRVARLLGVSHTWVNKLAKRFQSDSARFHRRYFPFAPATLEKLDHARQETLWHRQHGRLREPIRLRRVRYTLDDGRTRTARLPTKASLRAQRQSDDRSPAADNPSLPPDAFRDIPPWASGVACSNPHTKKPRGI